MAQKNVDAQTPKTKLIPQKRCKNSILGPLTPFKQLIPILRNGSRTIGTKNTQAILSTQTCPFDAIFEVFCACFVDLRDFGNKIKNDETDFSRFLESAFTKAFTKEVKDVYEERNELLLKLFPDLVMITENDIKVINCEMSINTMFMTLASSCPIIQSYNEFKKCVSCQFASQKVGKTFIPTDLNSMDLKNIEASIQLEKKRMFVLFAIVTL